MRRRGAWRTGLTLCGWLAIGAGGAVPLPNDPDFPKQWGLHNAGQIVNGGSPGVADADVDAPQAWAVFGGARNVTVAIVGHGIDPHPEFADRLLPGRGFVGDPFDTRDVCSQDTHLAGIVAARRNNGLGIAGLNDRAFLLPVRVVDGCDGTPAEAAEGIIWAVDAGADIVLTAMSFSHPDPALASAVQYAAAHDVLLIAPAGNSGDVGVTYPAAYPECIAVAATDALDQRSAISNRGPEVELAAPGRDVWSTWTGGGYGFQTPGRDTLSAAAFVAGVAALLQSYDPQLSAADIRTRMQQSADDLGPPGRDDSFGFGRINAHQALLAVPPPPVRFEPLYPVPETIPPEVESALPIRIATTVPLDTVEMVYRTEASAWSTRPLQAGRNGIWTIRFPPLRCNATLSFYLVARTTGGSIWTDPPEAPQSVHTSTAVYESVAFADDFEIDRGWTVEGGDNGSGRWDRVDPVGTSAQPEYDRTPGAGRFCYVTGQHFGGSDGTNDVDGGPLRLSSPVVALRGFDARIRYARWFVWNGQGNEDVLQVELSGDGGLTWVPAETVHTTGAWAFHEFLASDVRPGIPASIRLRFTAADLPNDSLTEAAVDDVRIADRFCAAVSGDIDGDGVIGDADAAAFVRCLSTATVPAQAECRLFDLDHDFRVDLTDVSIFQRRFGN